MELKRRVRGRMCFALLFLGNVASVVAGVTQKTGPGLDCTNDYEAWMFCDIEAHNCTEHNLTLRSNDGYGVKHCIFKQCDIGRCCCSFQIIAVSGETYTATVRKGGNIMVHKNISIKESVKPKAPTIVSVIESNGNFQIKWKTNMKGSFNYSLTANVTRHKKGDTEKVSEYVKPSLIDGLKYYEILGKHLEPSTTYVVSVKSYTDWSRRFSDSSEEVEFTTPMSHNTLFLAITISLSIAAVIISGAIYGCYVNFKTKWWDTVAKCSNPKLLLMHPSEQKFLKPVEPIMSSVFVEPLVTDDSPSWSKGSLRDTSSGSPQHSSGISTGSSCLSYANTEPADIISGVQDALGKALRNISPISPFTTNRTEFNRDSGLFSAPYNHCGVRADGISSWLSDFENKTYSILMPGCPPQITTDSSEFQTQAEMLCDSAYHSSEGNVLTCSDRQVPVCPLVNLPQVVSSLMPMDMSYQQCNADSGGHSYAEDSSLSSISSGTNTIASCDPVSTIEAGCESLDKMVSGAMKLNGKTEEATIYDKNPCYGCAPAGSHSFPPVDGDYQAFQNLVEQPDILFSEQRSVEKEEHLNKYPEDSFTEMPQSFLSPVLPGFINKDQGGKCPSELHTPFLPFSAYQPVPVITDNGYQSV